MRKAYTFCFLSLFLCFSVAAQKATINLKEGFHHIGLKGKKMNINLLEDDSYAIVTNGIPLDDIYYNLQNGLLDIYITKTEMSGKESLVILYPRGEKVPKVVGLSEWASLASKE
ncbi:MAG: hypothetical protein ED555_12625 [Allomuricauda sp.]|nr:MAG: hypothetical protein ED555_12625 [Allomuricauda sp.]